MEYFPIFQISPRTLYNYIYVRLLFANLNYLPGPPRLGKIPGLHETHGIGVADEDRMGMLPGLGKRPYGHDDVIIAGLGKAKIGEKCASANAQYFPFANARIFLDAKVPEKAERMELRKNVRLMVAGVVDSFKARI